MSTINPICINTKYKNTAARENNKTNNLREFNSMPMKTSPNGLHRNTKGKWQKFALKLCD